MISNVSPPPSPTKLMRLHAIKRISSGLKSMIAEKGSASAPTTPRKNSLSANDKPPISTTSSIESSKKLQSSDAQVQSSPRKLDHELMSLSDEIARHWVGEIQRTTAGGKGLRPSDAKVFLGQAVKIPVDQFSAELLKRIPASHTDSNITHSTLLSALYGKVFDLSPAGRVLFAARHAIMQDYGQNKLMLADLESIAESDPSKKKRYKQNMEDRARDCAQFLFGASASQSPGAVFSEELISLWRAMDGQLVALNLGKTERDRLAYELVLSRMVLLAAKGSDTEAGQANPTLFLATIKDASSKSFPQFCAAVLQQFDNERAAPTSTASSNPRNTSSSNALISNNSSSNNSSSNNSSSNDSSSNNSSSNNSSSNS